MLNRPTLMQRFKENYNYIMDDIDYEYGSRSRTSSQDSLQESLPSVGDEQQEQAHQQQQQQQQQQETPATTSSQRSSQSNSSGFGRIYANFRDTISEDYKELKKDLQGEFVMLRKDLSRNPSELRADIQDDLSGIMREFGNFQRRIGETAKATAAAAQRKREERRRQRTQSEEHAMETEIQMQIRKFELDLRSNDFLSELNKTVQENLPSANELVDYYKARPEMTEYTLTKELHRMEYTVFTRDGKKLTDKDAIAAYHKANEGTNEILWRSANQSLLGDVVTSVTSETGLIRPQLRVGTFVDDVSMTIDLGCNRPHARAECFLNVSIPGENGERLRLAGVLVVVYFSPNTEEFHARLTQIFPASELSNKQVEGAARSILE